MKQDHFQENWNDENDNPAGGTSFGRGFTISWQNGPLGRGNERKESNGAFVETVIDAVIRRIRYYQGSKFYCNENAQAINHLERALRWLNQRTRDREVHGVEGTHGKRPADGE